MTTWIIDRVANFWEKVSKTDSCWVWTRSTNINGYGKYWDGGRIVAAHRYAWAIAHGPIPDGMRVLHKCDNPLCVRPSHLFLGTQKDNMRDMIRKGRRGYTGMRGEQNPKAKLSPNQVLVLRERYRAGETRAELAKAYCLDWAAVDRIVNHKSWSHLSSDEPSKYGITESDRSSTTVLMPSDY